MLSFACAVIPDCSSPTGSSPAIEVLADTRIVDEGHIVTSAGISAGIDMSLHVVSRLFGEPVAAQTARNMEYDWTARSRS